MKNLFICIIFSILAITPICAEIYSGTCGIENDGSNLTWTLNTNDSTLVIDGSGKMNNWFNYSTTPWYQYRSYIKHITFSEQVTNIGYNAFYDCYTLSTITIPDNITSIEGGAFKHCRLLSVSVGNGCTTIGGGAFYQCLYLKSIALGNNIDSIGNRVFVDCIELTSISFSENLRAIGEQTFKSCTHLTSVILPDNLRSIGNSAFLGCYNITELVLGQNLETIGEQAFGYCSRLKGVILPNSVTNVGDYAFLRCDSLTSPIYNTHVFARMLESYEGSYVIPHSVDLIAGGAFDGCRKLSFIIIPNSVKTIGTGAFYNCSGLTSLLIPQNVTTLGKGAFSDCTGLSEIYDYAVTPQKLMDNYVFNNVPKYSCKLYVPSESISLYKTYPIWSEFNQILPIQNPTNIENTPNNTQCVEKFLHNGQILIEKNGKTYNAVGTELK